jgi:hypothetical protein
MSKKATYLSLKRRWKNVKENVTTYKVPSMTCCSGERYQVALKDVSTSVKCGIDGLIFLYHSTNDAIKLN